MFRKKPRRVSLAEQAEHGLFVQFVRENAANDRIDDLEVKLARAHLSKKDAIDKQMALDEIIEIAEQAGL